MADLNVKVGLDKSEFQTGLAAMQTDAARFGQTISNIKPGNVSGAFKNIAADLASARTPAEAFGSVLNNVTGLLKGTALGAAASGIGSLLSAPFTELSGLVSSAVSNVKNTLDSLEGQGPAISFEDATAQAQQLDSAILSIQNSINQIDQSPFLRIADSFVGAKNELEELQKSLQRVKASSLSEGAFMGANQAEELVGKSAEERERMKIKARAEKERQTIKTEFEGTGLNAETALADVDRKESAELKDLDSRVKTKTDEEEARKAEKIAATYKQADERRRRDALAMLDVQSRINELKKEEAELNEKISTMPEGQNRADAVLEQSQISGQILKEQAELARQQAQEQKATDAAAARAAKSPAEDALREENLRPERLRTTNQQRGNAPDFDPREALINRFGLGEKPPPGFENPVAPPFTPPSAFTEMLRDIPNKPDVNTPQKVAAAKDGIDLSKQEAVLEAQQEAARLQRMMESNLTGRGFDDQTAARMARSQAAGIAGALPGAESLRDISTRPDVNTPQKVTLEQVPQLSDVLNKLDTLIQKAGSFN